MSVMRSENKRSENMMRTKISMRNVNMMRSNMSFRSEISMFLWLIIFLSLVILRVESEQTLGYLQNEGDAIYNMSQCIPSLVTLDGKKLKMIN